ncbi:MULTISPECIES: TAXI family TRAP transporter solute-binding subunit [Kitasatospora]|uniref:Putative transporter n=1 Tax=Kitasatospora setae (strain ATCC 33774 / DSM 43861 / JCM 3304 / KCC A-0304 / NBRC 14216 / KM-6054) TaxID=452652 RepID=E4NI14_KITSK|nr:MULTISPECIES: TAXI family TRAP transporter solute-binding subunit [Kitasatospora]BAJ31144.1 putative transporter [Kitasatospora setae KM-6054]
MAAANLPSRARAAAGAAARAALRGRLLRLAAVLLLVAGGLGGWWVSSARSSAGPHGRVAFATGVTGGVYDRYGVLLRDYLGQHLPGLRVQLDNSVGSMDNLERLVSGRDDFAVATADAVATFASPDKPKLRAIARLYDDYIQLVVPAESPVRSVADLRGLRVGVGPDKSGVNLVTRRLLEAAGVDPDHGVRGSATNVTESADKLQKGELDAFFWSGGLPTAALSDLSARTPIRIVPMGELSDPLHQLAGPGMDAYRAATIPADAYPDVEPERTAVPTVAVPNLLVTRADVDPALVEALTRAVIDSRDDIGRKVHAAQLVDLRTAVYTDPLPLHDGAKRYYLSVKP